MTGERHLPFFKLLEALESPGCPVCRQADEAAGDTIRHLLHELVNDDRLRSRLAGSFGFCHDHAWRVVAQTDVLGTAILHRELVDRFRRQLRDGEPVPNGAARCLVCEVAEDTAAGSLQTLVAHLDDPAVEHAFAASDGLCRDHYAEAARRAPPGTGLDGLQRRCLDRLVAQLDELIRKQDHRFRDEELEPGERTAWMRAVASVSGLDVGRLPRARPASFPPARRSPR